MAVRNKNFNKSKPYGFATVAATQAPSRSKSTIGFGARETGCKRAGNSRITMCIKAQIPVIARPARNPPWLLAHTSITRGKIQGAALLPFSPRSISSSVTRNKTYVKRCGRMVQRPADISINTTTPTMPARRTCNPLRQRRHNTTPSMSRIIATFSPTRPGTPKPL